MTEPPNAPAFAQGIQDRWRDTGFYRWWRLRVVSRVEHEAVVARVLGESGWSPRYAFMTMMSAGIAVLGLLLSSPAVVIGAMLISPLMNPILGLGFSLALFDFREMRRSVTALVVGAVVAVLFTALIVLVSPLRAPTAEILARTRPNLFDLVIALFASLAGSFAIIRGKGDTIVGVAIATALMPPLAVVGFGLATWNLPILGGALALFFTNLVTIALSATIMARYYGFGHRLSSQQSWTQTVLLLLVFVAMAIPLGISLSRIAREALTVNQVRSYLSETFGAQSRVTQLDVDFERDPIAVRSIVIAPRSRAVSGDTVKAGLIKALGRPLTLQIDEVLLDPHAGALDRQRAEVKAAEEAKDADAQGAEIARLVAIAAGVGPEAVTLDQGHQRATVTASVLPGATLATYRALEQRVQAVSSGWHIVLVPPFGDMPTIRFADGSDTLDQAGTEAVGLSAWAAQRWNIAALAVPGLPASPVDHPLLNARRAQAVATLLRERGIASVSAPAAGQSFRLAAAPDGGSGSP
ncbi:DUF389 domain-containing protein [Sphingomonas sp. CGMCC 1.13654]|uniref:DUF389 domain-containing protein n=1 Tax=Sphingomonas chungangi TaxID=2683589 RepID=A0A838L905_9SPHN|nr:DUF389 domain-containing protein [Sphingomonas chungangi]MBA2935185.1 DUF389 domain-containing protein [Sphingomonas chungangi]MVW55263.1 DUF389 domain-containing protein [Sphingomonas chungangi]